MRPRRNDDNRTREPQTRINEAIRVREILLIDETGENKGVTSIEDAQKYAIDRSLDLVEISPQARPPVCRVMDYGKWKYEQNVKAKQARKHRSQVTIKEIKFRPKIGIADYETKTNHVRRFLDQEDKVKITIMFRGREVVHHELGRRILERVASDVADIGSIESHPNLEGRNMTMMIAPYKKKEPAKEPGEGDGDIAAADTPATDAPEAVTAATEAVEAEAPATEAPAADTPAADTPPADTPAATNGDAPAAEADAPAKAPVKKAPAAKAKPKAKAASAAKSDAGPAAEKAPDSTPAAKTT